MSLLRAIVIALLALIVVAPARANFGGGSSPKPDLPQSQGLPQESSPTTARQLASGYYGDAYNDVNRAKKELATGKDKNAEKRFRRALERGTRATEIDSTYAEAFNLVGYCHRQLKEYEPSVTAYQKALKLQPDYAAAREYLGETYVAMGKVDLAREQLAWLETNDKAEDAASLKAALDAYAKQHPETATASTATPAPATEAAPASADSTGGR